MRVLAWNIGRPSPTTLRRQVDAVMALDPDVAFFSEWSPLQFRRNSAGVQTANTCHAIGPMLAESGFSEDMIGWVNIAPGVIAVIGGLIALALMDRINRRTNFLWGYGMTALSHILIAISMMLLFPEGNPIRPWAFLVLIIIMIMSENEKEK